MNAHTCPVYSSRFLVHLLWPTSLIFSLPLFLHPSLRLCPLGSGWEPASGFSYHMVKAGNRLDKHSPFLLTHPRWPPPTPYTHHARTHTYTLTLSINKAAVRKITRIFLASLLLSSLSLDPPPPPPPLLSSFLPGLKSQPQTHGPASPHLSVITHTASQLLHAVLHLRTKV